jgi:hypothetical protein
MSAIAAGAVLLYDGAMRNVSPRLVGMVGASCLLAGWLLGSTVRPPVAHTQAPAPRVAPDPPLPRLDIPSVAARRERLVAAMEAPSPGRNPFAFGEVRRASAAPVGAAPSPPPDLAPALEIPSAPPPPAWTLVGVAVEQAADGERITAILSSGGDVHLVTVGAMLPGGYTVVRVALDHAALVDATGAERVVRLP